MSHKVYHIKQLKLEELNQPYFFPLYIDNVYIGYWIIENAEKHAFDNIDLSVIDVVKRKYYNSSKNNILSKYNGRYS